MTVAAAAFAALPASLLTIWALRLTPAARHVVAAPRADRWHTRSTPLLGGSGIFAGMLVAAGIAVAAGVVPASWQLGGILGGCGILFSAGLIDDVYGLPPFAKIAAQGGAAALVIASGIRVELITNDIAADAVAVVWLIGMTNAFNLLDNMDGLAASLATVGCAFFAIDAFTTHPNHMIALLALGVCFGCLGFLPYNLRLRRQASVFMGDSGSQVLGFTLGSLGLATSWTVAGSTVATLLIPLLVLAVPILDTAPSTAVPFVEGRPITQGARDHASRRLVRGGLSEKSTVVLLAAVAFGLGLSSLAYSALGNPRVTLVGVLISFVVLVQFAGFLADLDRGDADVSDRPVLLRLLAPRRLIESLVDFALISVAFGVSYLLFTTGDGTTNQKHIFLVSLPVILAIRFLAFIGFGLYSGVWRFAGAREAGAITAAVAISEPIAVGIIWVSFGPFGDFPASIYVVDALFCVAAIGASRFGERALFHAMRSLKDRDARRRTLIVGAGRSGRSLLRELRE